MTQTTHVAAGSRAEEMPFGSTILPDGRVRFRLWAPSAKSVQLRLYEGDNESTLPMDATGQGWYLAETNKAKDGTLYHYVVDGALAVPDPASRFQPKDVHGPSMVIDPQKFSWKAAWNGRPWEEVVLYELHVGTFTEEGTFGAVTQKLDYLRDLGVTAIELMPVADFPGKWNWGYDGVLLFAPDSSYGTPDDLRTLIDTAHEKGMMVFLDVVYNHFGPEGNYLHVYAKQFFNDKHKTPWGAAINFDGENSEPVRQFFLSNVLYWLNEYRFDGLRFDAVHAIKDDSSAHVLKQIAQSVHESIKRASTQTGNERGTERKVHLVLENDDNISDYLVRESANAKYYNAQWNDDIHHAMHVVLTGEEGGYYADYTDKTSDKSAVGHLARCLTEGFAYQNDPSPYRDNERRGQSSKHLPATAFVSFTQNHDQIGNRAFGERISALTALTKNKAVSAVFLLSPNIPMLYMGQEWGASTPFFYFCDLGPDLAPLVTEGRRSEFAKFPEFQDPEKRNAIPDPVDAKTFWNSKLNWGEQNTAEHAELLKYHQSLLSLRKQHVMPMLASCIAGGARVIEQKDGLIFAHWKCQDAGTLWLVANLSDVDAKATSAEIKKMNGTKAIFESSPGLLARVGESVVPAWSVMWAVSNDKV